MGAGAAGGGGRRRLRAERRLPRRPDRPGHRLCRGHPFGRDRPPARRAADRPGVVRQRPQAAAPLPGQAVLRSRSGHWSRATGVHRGDLAGRLPRADALTLPGAEGTAGRRPLPPPGPGRRHRAGRLLGRRPARSHAADRVARQRRQHPPITGCPTCPPTPRSPNWSAWPRSAGASSTTTANSSTASAWTTSKAAPGPAGTTTSPWSPPPTPSSPNSAWPQKPLHRTHPLPDPRHHPRPAELLDRHLHHLPPPPAQNIHHQPELKSQSNLTESY